MSQRGHLRREGRAWRLLYRAGGRGERRLRSARVGSLTELPTKTQARARADVLLEQLAPRSFHVGSSMSWREWCVTYEAKYLALLSRGSRATRASIIHRHLATSPELARPLHRIDSAAVQAFILAQHGAGAAASTVRARFNLVRTLLRAAADAGLAVTPPVASRLRFPKDETAPKPITARAFTPAEVAALLEQATDPLLTAIALGRFAGLRAGELCGLEWTDIDLAAATLSVRQQALAGELRPLKAKSAQATLALPAPLLARLRAYRAAWTPNPRGLLFAGADGRPVDQARLRRMLHRLCAALGIPRRGLHALRHALGCALAAAGVNPEAARRAMRHASIRTTMVYLNASAADVAQALALASVEKSLRTDRAPPQESRPSLNAGMISEGTNASPGEGAP